MDQIEVRFADGTTRLHPPGTLLKDLLPMKGEDDQPVAARMDGQLMDLQAPLERGGSLEWIPLSSEQGV